MEKREWYAAIGVLLRLFPILLLSKGHPGAGRLVRTVLVCQESPDLVLEPHLVPRPLIVAVDRDDRECLAGIFRIGEDGELVATPELQVDGLVEIVRALDLQGADIVQRRLGLSMLHHAVYVVG